MYKDIDTKIIDRRITKTKLWDAFKLNGHSYIVQDIYPYNVLCRRDDGVNESFSLGDLVLMGRETPYPDNFVGFEMEEEDE